MRAIAVLLGAVLFALPVGAASGVTVSQLEQFLLSKRTMKLSDAEIAEQGHWKILRQNICWLPTRLQVYLPRLRFAVK